MGLKEDLLSEVTNIFKQQWTTRDGTVVPEPENLKLSNDAVKLDGTVLYADMSESTKLVDNEDAPFAAEVYKTYLVCAARVVKSEGGVITAYDGDRIMAVFLGTRKNSNAATAALKINYAVKEIINSALATQYPSRTYRLQHVVGVDTSRLFVARIGVRKDNDLVWVGRAANYAAKLCAIDDPNKIFITDAVFKMLNEPAKYGGNPKRLMWESCSWPMMNGMTIHRSSWTWKV